MKHIFSLNELNLSAFETWQHGSSYGGSELPLASEWGAQHLGFHLETLNPKKFSCPYHRHSGEEELMLVIKGEAVLRQDGVFRRVQSGDLIFFALGVTHQFYNPNDELFVFFALSNKNAVDVCEYPDSRKTYDRGAKKIFQDGQLMEDYWAGEEEPATFWPEEWLSSHTTKNG